MPGNTPLFSPQGTAALFLIAGVALLGAIVRLCLRPGKTPRNSLANFGGCMALGTLIGIGLRNSKSEWVQDLFELIVGFSAMLGPEVFKLCLQELPRGFLLTIRVVAGIIANPKPPDHEPPSTL